MAAPIKNNLPPQSQQWVRDMERRVAALERDNRMLNATVVKNATQIGSIQNALAGVQELLGISVEIRTFAGSGTSTFPAFGSGSTPFHFDYVAPEGYSKVSFVWSFQGRRTSGSGIDPVWYSTVYLDEGPAVATFESAPADSTRFTGSFTGTVPSDPGQLLSFSTSCYMVSESSAGMTWDTSGIVFAHN